MAIRELWGLESVSFVSFSMYYYRVLHDSQGFSYADIARFPRFLHWQDYTIPKDLQIYEQVFRIKYAAKHTIILLLNKSKSIIFAQ
jgi:hypothetical protein